MSRLTAVAVLAQCAILTTGKLTVTQPEYREIENTDAPFGYVPYGHTIKGRVYYAGDCCERSFGKKNLRGPPFGRGVIVLADRGHCDVAQKISNAEAAGAEAVIIADDTLEPLMIDDGTMSLSPVNLNARDMGDGKSISIPSIFVNKTEGDWLKARANWAVGEISWLADRTSGVVKLELWDSIFDGRYSQLNKESSVELFAKIALAMGQKVQFTPRYFLLPGNNWFQDGEMWDCRESYNKKSSPCYSQCTNKGRYCLPNPSHSSVTGSDMLREDLRQMCIHQWAFANKSDLWWQYIVLLEQECGEEVSQMCSEKVMRKLSIDVGRIMNCVAESGAAEHEGLTNYLFEREIDLSKSTRIMSVPKLIVNDEPYWGGLDCPHPLSPATCGVLAKLCSAFTAASTPTVCNGVIKDAKLFLSKAPVLKVHTHLTEQIRAFAASVRGQHHSMLNDSSIVAVVACVLMIMGLVIAVIGVATHGRQRVKPSGNRRRKNGNGYDRVVDMEGDGLGGAMSGREYTKLITQMSKKGQWKEAMDCLTTMKSHGITPDAYHYAGVMTACAKGRNYKQALQLLDTMQADGVKPDTWVYNCAITACEKGNQWKKALALLTGMQEKGVKPDVVSYSAAISACANGRKWEKSLELLDTMQKDGLVPDLITYNAAISSCEKGCQWEKALELLNSMRKRGRDSPQPDVISYNAAISACEKCGQWPQAIALLDTMKDHYNIMPNVISYNAAISACEKAGQWKKALELLAKMQSDDETPRPDLITYNASISACEKGAQWEKALELFEFMHSIECNVVPDVVTYNATISSCEKGAQWEKALELLSRMHKVGVHADVVSYSAAISACEKGGQWQKALALLAQMGRASITADVIVYRAAIVACGKSGQWQEADRLYSQAVSDGVMKQTAQSTTEGQEGMTLELSGSPAAVIVAALRHTLFALVSKNKDKVQDLYLKTESASAATKKKKKKKSPYPLVSRIEVGDILKTLRPHPLANEPVNDGLIKVSKADLLCWLDTYTGAAHANASTM